MSRVGKKPVNVPDTVSIDVSEENILVKGPKGELTLQSDSAVKITLDDDVLTVSVESTEKSVRAKHGLYRALIANMIVGVTEGYAENLELHGIGYRVQPKGNDLEFTLGYSHPVHFKVPEGITTKVDGQTKLRLEGIDKQLVGETSARIRRLRKRDAYKGKGIHKEGAVIRKKPGKSVKK